MSSAASSILLGTSGLALAAIASLTLAYLRPGVASDHVAKVRLIAIIAVAIQAGHFGEEYLQQFYLRFPSQLGLALWSEEFFVIFNVVCLIVWVLAIANLTRFPRLGSFPLWFLAIAAIANGVVHPILSLVDGGYFPGLWSSPLVGILGVVLISALVTATRASSSSHGIT